MSTMAFLISMPDRLRKPSSAMKPNGSLASSSPTLTPITASGTVNMIKHRLSQVVEQHHQDQQHQQQRHRHACGDVALRTGRILQLAAPGQLVAGRQFQCLDLRLDCLEQFAGELTRERIRLRLDGPYPVAPHDDGVIEPSSRSR
jgi:hypothetical protein